MNSPKYAIKGINGQLYVYENKVEIKRKGFFAFVNHGLKGDKTIPISSIKSIQIKKAGLIAGYIQFGIGGALESRGGVQAANYDENTITFGNTNDNKVALQIKDYIESIINNSSQQQNTVVQASSEADEILKFKKLLDDGVITQEEFDAKKKQILNL
ncbi:MAG: SHOCT domain-containing protein [Clostridia bacterium]|nr:SHOCT domain-containing protein [Clostridia bacterium]